MGNFAIIRLGKDSVADIKKIDAWKKSPTPPVLIDVSCTQVPSELALGDFAFICLGSDNNKGGAIDWTRGLRALGTVTKKSGGPNYADQWVVGVEIKVILPQSVNQKDLLGIAPVAYYWCSDVPVLGVDTHANQTVQMIKRTEPNQNVMALVYGLNAIHPTFRAETVAAYPELENLFAYEPPDPKGESSAPAPSSPSSSSGPVDFANIVKQFKADADVAELRIDPAEAHRFLASLLSKRFLIASGLAGSGKTKLAQAFATWLTPSASIADPFVPGTIFESDRVKYVVKKSDSVGVEFWNENGHVASEAKADEADGDADDEKSEKDADADAGEGEGGKRTIKNMVPREIIEEWANWFEANKNAEDVPILTISNEIEKTSLFSPYLHRFRPFLKLAALALIKARVKKGGDKCYEVVPVGADWTGNENILGYANGLDVKSYVSKPALDLMLQAKANPSVPHILILDEMNLSHVERYFADVLSVIESDEKINLHRDAERKSDGVVVPNEIGLPKNLFIIGTVNVDETTYMFSPKVLDRASVIEFRMDAEELAIFLGNPSKPDLLKIAGKGAAFGPAFVAQAGGQVPQFADPLKSQYEAEMLLFFKALSGNGAEFGYRVAHEAARFIHFYKLLGGHADSDLAWFAKAFDCLVAQKFLPKLHGSRAKLGPLLKKLWFLCVSDTVARGDNALAAAEAAAKSTVKTFEPSPVVPDGAPYAVSAEKIARMWRLLNDNGFASFAEA
ncbi:McrB family protein [Rhodoferax sp. BLA1]|uniref:McrB family protein n=1 Tax=Rhodoferax sp. BLA1 TaxID=2576062 RepID=UPI0015D3640A|nr:hypothetical protein [Rhodoferax sp. BLA1]